LPAAGGAAIVHVVSLAATRELAEMLGVDQLELLRANRDRPWTIENGVMAFASVRPGDVFRLPDGGEVHVEQMGRGPLVPYGEMLGSLTDFQSFDQPGSSFHAAWTEVGSQVLAEGGDITKLQTAANDFTSAFEQMTSSSQGFGVQVQDALDYAKKYTIAGQTVLGAVQHVQGLIAAAQGASTPQEVEQVFNMFTGTLIGAAVAAGAVSAGVGSLIVAGVGVALDLLQSAGLFGTAPTGTTVCQQGGARLSMDKSPTIQVGCAASMTAKVVNQGATNWRKFPTPRGSVPGEADWFTKDYVHWYGDDWSSWSGYRLIDSAFPVWHYMACAPVPTELASFNQAFSQAWKANAEYALNGLKAQEDAQVLLHAVRIWNRAHSSSSTYDLAPAALPGYFSGDAGNIYHPTLDEIAAGRTKYGGASLCSPDGWHNGTIPYYGAVLMNRVRDLVSSDDAASSMVGGNLRINVGAPNPIYKVIQGGLYKWDTTRNEWMLVLTPQQVADLQAALAKASAGVTTAAPKGMSTGTKVAVGAGAVALGTAGLWLGIGKPLTIAAAQSGFGHLWRKVFP
jgi:hypothetical protein